MHDRIDAFWNVRENRLFGGVLNFQQDSSNQSGTGPLEYRVPVPKSTDCMVSLYGEKICLDQDDGSREGRRGITPKINLEHPRSADHHCDRNDLGSAVGYRSRLIDPGNRS